jgi:hypothetical protein
MIATLDVADRQIFRTDFYEKEEPVLLRNVATIPGAVESLARTLKAQIVHDEPDEKRARLWHDVRPDTIKHLYETPQLIRELFESDDVLLRERYVRVWLSVRGHHTPWHYDANSQHVFNLQLRGTKRWRIVSPETPLMCVPFSNIGLYGNYSLSRKRSFDFEAREGDLLFLPRYWFHSVTSLGDLNINLNWVLTSRRPTASRTARREAELLWIKRRLYRLLPSDLRRSLDAYGIRQRNAVGSVVRAAFGIGVAEDALTGNVGAGSAIVCALREALKIPLLLAHLPLQLRTVAAMKRSSRRLRTRLLDAPIQPSGPR